MRAPKHVASSSGRWPRPSSSSAIQTPSFRRSSHHWQTRSNSLTQTMRSGMENTHSPPVMATYNTCCPPSTPRLCRRIGSAFTTTRWPSRGGPRRSGRQQNSPQILRLHAPAAFSWASPNRRRLRGRRVRAVATVGTNPTHRLRRQTELPLRGCRSHIRSSYSHRLGQLLHPQWRTREALPRIALLGLRLPKCGNTLYWAKCFPQEHGSRCLSVASKRHLSRLLSPYFIHSLWTQKVHRTLRSPNAPRDHAPRVVPRHPLTERHTDSKSVTPCTPCTQVFTEHTHAHGAFLRIILYRARTMCTAVFTEHTSVPALRARPCSPNTQMLSEHH